MSLEHAPRGTAASQIGGGLPDALLNEHEAAAYLGLSVATLRRWRWAGRPPVFIKIGNAVRYDPKVIAALIEAGRRTSTSGPGQETSV